MSLVPYLGFALVALAAIGFATFAIWRGTARRAAESGPGQAVRPRDQKRARALLAAAIAVFLLGVGGGTYWMLGQPGLAFRSAQGLGTRDIRGLIPYLIARVRKAPNDEQAWVYLGRAYLSSGDAEDASKALARAVTLSRLLKRPNANLDSVYGETLVAANGGALTPEAEAAFNAAFKLDPKDAAARFYLGQARADRGDKQGALALWQSLEAEAPANSALHQALVDRIAMLTAQTGAKGFDPRAMVAGLAARLKDNPNDAPGWQRLIRAYTVLGERAQAQQALATARATFAADKNAQTALDSEAKDLKLN